MYTTHTTLNNIQKGGKTSEVTEETDGWMRLRTVTQDWSSDEEKGDRVEIDLRDKLKVSRESLVNIDSRCTVHVRVHVVLTYM